ncbi:MAG: hypothetical protein KBS81_07465, partial [Spirochaetales bacterium]|nr:hypothetical protein [Candidatus Physcosoma equi]
MLEDTEKGTVLRDGVLAFFLSSVMYYFGLTNLLFVCPLLRFSANHGKKAFGYAALAELCYVVGYAFYICSGSELYAFSLVLNLFIPVSLLAAGAIWLFASEMRWQKRLFLSFLPAILLTAALAVYLNMDRALFASVFDRYRNVFADLLSALFNDAASAVDSDYFFEMIATTVGVMMLPVILAAVCASCFYYENVLYSKESGIDGKV